jgi:hypothetical protein
VLDTVYVGTLLLGTDREYVDAPYDHTDLSDAEVTFIDVSGVEPPLSYPAGYFALANPEQQFTNVTDPMMATPGFVAPGIPSMPNPTISGNGLINTPAITPNPNPNAVQGTLPSDGPLGPSTDNPTIPGSRKGRRGGRPIGTGNVNSSDVAKNDTPEPSPSVDPTKPLNEKDINRRPFVDLAGAVNAMLANKEINLDSEFSVTARGKLTKEGKLDKETFKFTKAASNDPKMIDVVKKSIEAFNDSGMLQYLEQLSGKDLNLALEQNKDNVLAEVRSEVEGESRAGGLKSALNFGLGLAIRSKEEKILKLQAENKPENADALQNAMDELELLRKTEITSEGKQLIVKFASPKDVMHNLIRRKLDAQAKDLKKESGVNSVGANDNTARK